MRSPFQSTLSRGERPFEGRIKWVLGNISIHALTRRAARRRYLKPFGLKAFQSTLSRGERHEIAKIDSDIEKFQSTLSRGERLVVVKLAKGV